MNLWHTITQEARRWFHEELPGSLYASGGMPPSVHATKALADVHRLSDLLPYETYDPEQGLFCNDDAVGFVLEITPAAYAGLAANEAEKHNIGCYFYGTKGTFHMGWRDGWTFHPADAKKEVVHQDAQHEEPDGHSIKLLWADFIQAIQSGKRPTCDIEIGHQATNLSLLGMLSYKIGRSIQWDGVKEQIVGDPEANKLLRREYRAPWVYPT